MANWKKVIVSGSTAELAAVTVDGTVTANAFSGDGSSLTGVQASGLNIEGFTDGTGITIAATDKLLLSDAGTEKYVNVSQLFDTADFNSEVNAQIAAASAADLSDITDAGSGVIISTSEREKLTNIEASADVTDTANVTAAGALMDSEVTDLAGIKSVTVSTLQPKPSEGAFANGDKTKLDGIEAGADVTDTANVTAAGALMDSEVDADIKTLSLPANTTISTFGASLVDDANAAAARTTLGVDAAGTDNFGGINVSAGEDPDLITGGETISFIGKGATEVVYEAATNTFTITSTDENDNTTYSAGNGISLSGTTFSVAGGDGLTQNASGLAVDATVLRTTGDGVVSGSAQIGVGGDLSGTAASATVTKVQGVALTSGEVTQVGNIGSTTISSTQWGYVGNANQNVRTSDSPTFVGGTFTGNVSVAGDLSVNGAVTSINTTELNVEDQFILLASGSGEAVDSGFIFANAGDRGQAFFFDREQNRPSWGNDIAWDAVAATPSAYISRVFDTDAAHEPIAERGSIMVSGEDVFIYS